MTLFNKKQTLLAGAVALTVLGAILVLWPRQQARPATPRPAAQARPALTVVAVKPQMQDWPMQLPAHGNIAAWQEAIVGSELTGLRLTEVLVNVGDIVKRGQVLARFDAQTVAAEVAQQQASVDDAEATMAEAAANADRARTLALSGAWSKQQINQYLTAERSAGARLRLAQARLHTEQIHLRQTQVVAADDGQISSRSATVGAVGQQGMELFRLIRKGRLEWRAEVMASDISYIRPGQAVSLAGANGSAVAGRVRMIAPVVDVANRSAIVYVDLPQPQGVSAGMYASGQFDIGRAAALTLPQSAVVTRDGFDFVFRIGADRKVVQTKVSVARRVGNLVEIASGIGPDMVLVEQGAGFLADGDSIKMAPEVKLVAARRHPAAN